MKISCTVRFMRAARMKRMLAFGESKMELNEKFSAILVSMTDESNPCLPFELLYSDLEKAMQTSDTKVVLETIPILETSAAAGPVAPFEFDLASQFIKTCMVTTFPDTRQKMMKTITHFFVRIRQLYAKDIRRYDPALHETNPERHAALWAPLDPLYNFLYDVTRNAEENLYLDKPIEGAFPIFDVLKITMDFFGGITCTMNKAKSFEPINFLTKAHRGPLLASRNLFMFFINSLKSSWSAVRNGSFELLCKYADEFP